MPFFAVIATVLFGVVLFLSPLVASRQDHPAWILLLTALLALGTASMGIQARRDREIENESHLLWPSLAVLGAAALGFLSLVWQWFGVYHGKPMYLDVMLTAWGYLASLAGLMWALPRLAANRAAFYALLLCLVAGATFASGYGLNHYMVEVKAHMSDWREFATSSDPDFFAGFLVMTLPVTLALWLGAPGGNGRRIGLLYGLAFLIQLPLLPVTQSRFALISAALGFLVFACAYAVARRRGMAVPALKWRLIALAVVLLIGLLFGSISILHRFKASTFKAEAHSGDFRIWTWKGAVHLAEAHPLLGTGPGTFVYTYPRYASVGFTQMAHDSFLQLADDIGILGLLLILAGFVGVLVLGAGGLAVPPCSDEAEAPAAMPAKAGKRTRAAQTAPPPAKSNAEAFLDQVAAPDDRLILAGLLGGLVAGGVQNLIDSDIYFFFNGVTLFALAGFALRFARTPEKAHAKPIPAGALLAGAGVYVLLFLGAGWGAVAAVAALSGGLETAASMVPWNATYLGGMGWEVYPSRGETAQAEDALSTAAALTPSAPNFNRLGHFLQHEGKLGQALSAYEEGLRHDPNDLELLLNAAQLNDQLGNHAAALALYHHMVDLQNGPYGQVLAVPEVIFYRYIYADAAVGDQSFSEGDLAQAKKNYQAAQAMLEKYANVGGSYSTYQRFGNGGNPDPQVDQSLATVYGHVMSQLQAIAEQTGNRGDLETLHEHLAYFSAKFAAFPH